MSTAQVTIRSKAVRDFVRQVKARIKESGIEMTELEERSGVSRQFIYRVLAGKQMPSLEIAEKIAKAVGLSIEFSAAK